MRNDVLEFIKEIKINKRYYQKNNGNILGGVFSVSKELALYIFYDALYKYKVVIGEVYLFSEYLDGVRKLYKRLSSFQDIRVGINQLIGKMVTIKLGIKMEERENSRRAIISYIYEKYILNGYFIHGFSSSYLSKIVNNDFVSEEYFNYYDDFETLREIFKKYGVNVLAKDFSKKETYFCDDLVVGCYYSKFSPGYFYEFLCGELKCSSYLINDFSVMFKSAEKYMNNIGFSNSDKLCVKDILFKEWSLLYSKKSRVSLIAVPRILLSNETVSPKKYLDDKSEIDEVVDRLLSPKYGNVSFDGVVNSLDFSVLNFEDDELCENSFDIIESDELYGDSVFRNAYGSASVLIILGTLLVSFGVIMTIFMIIGGM